MQQYVGTYEYHQVVRVKKTRTGQRGLLQLTPLPLLPWVAVSEAPAAGLADAEGTRTNGPRAPLSRSRYYVGCGLWCNMRHKNLFASFVSVRYTRRVPYSGTGYE